MTPLIVQDSRPNGFDVFILARWNNAGLCYTCCVDTGESMGWERCAALDYDRTPALMESLSAADSIIQDYDTEMIVASSSVEPVKDKWVALHIGHPRNGGTVTQLGTIKREIKDTPQPSWQSPVPKTTQVILTDKYRITIEELP